MLFDKKKVCEQNLFNYWTWLIRYIFVCFNVVVVSFLCVFRVLFAPLNLNRQCSIVCLDSWSMWWNICKGYISTDQRTLCCFYQPSVATIIFYAYIRFIWMLNPWETLSLSPVLNTVKPVLRGHIWDKEKVIF